GIPLLMGRYAVGAESLSPAASEPLLESLDSYYTQPVDRLRYAAVAAELSGNELALTQLDSAAEAMNERLDAEENLRLNEQAESTDPAEDAQRQAEEHNANLAEGESPITAEDILDAPLEAPEWFTQDLATFRAIYSAPDPAASAEVIANLDPDTREAIIERHAWFGRLALSHGAEDSDPMRSDVLAAATRTLLVLAGGVILFAIAALAGFVLLIIALIAIAQRKLTFRYAPPAPGGTVFLEAFTLFLIGFIAVSFLSTYLDQLTGVDLTFILVWLLLLTAFWPRVRGIDTTRFRYALGWHKGRGVLREIAAGFLGYLAGLPVFILGIAFTLLLGVIVGLIREALQMGEPDPTSHPVDDQLGDNINIFLILQTYLLAAVWAPVVEETLFRGAFYHHLRGRLAPIGAALLVAFVFAIIHPQGLIAVPALMSLAIVFAAIREWRGSVIAAITAHAIHNFCLISALMLALS
ncbi:MAG: type II CAAX endopeptidase family protein, partial [Planctomycetota bacterium]|nr:type II CAAX endopeptidase family protein [Planctomycetota bacterium]